MGAADDTGNLGVSALMWSVVAGLARAPEHPDLTVFDNGRGWREDVAAVGTSALRFHRFGMWPSRRLHRPESLWNLQASARLGGLRNRGARALLDADAVWDISGGDSFGDLYGDARWRLITDPKKLVLRHGGHLVLLPQTYGPFRTAQRRAEAAAIVRGADAAWARDPDSYAVLRELLGDAFEPTRHRLGVDVAFGLPVEPPTALPDRLSGWLADRHVGPTVGVNVSGLVHNDEQAAARFGLRLDYRGFVRGLVDGLLGRGCRIVLVPHVLDQGAESDRIACLEVAEHVQRLHPSAPLLVAPPGLSASQTKWLISQLDWFLGTRMHSTIAGLSSGVPTSSVAYSLKARGVFATCALADQVIDGRTTGTDETIGGALSCFEDREQVRARLAEVLPDVVGQAHGQLAEFAVGVGGARPGAWLFAGGHRG